MAWENVMAGFLIQERSDLSNFSRENSRPLFYNAFGGLRWK